MADHHTEARVNTRRQVPGYAWRVPRPTQADPTATVLVPAMATYQGEDRWLMDTPPESAGWVLTVVTDEEADARATAH